MRKRLLALLEPDSSCSPDERLKKQCLQLDAVKAVIAEAEQALDAERRKVREQHAWAALGQLPKDVRLPIQRFNRFGYHIAYGQLVNMDPETGTVSFKATGTVPSQWGMYYGDIVERSKVNTNPVRVLRLGDEFNFEFVDAWIAFVQQQTQIKRWIETYPELGVTLQHIVTGELTETTPPMRLGNKAWHFQCVPSGCNLVVGGGFVTFNHLAATVARKHGAKVLIAVLGSRLLVDLFPIICEYSDFCFYLLSHSSCEIKTENRARQSRVCISIANFTNSARTSSVDLSGRRPKVKTFSIKHKS